jgi:hypothetical protein
MFTQLAMGALMCLSFAFAPVEAWGGVDLQSFGIEPSPPSTHVFNTVGLMEPPGQEAGPGATVAWPVTINLALLNTLPPTLQVNFADRASVTLTRLRSERSGNALFWMGQGGDCSGMFRVAADGGFKGTVSCLNAPYGINHAQGSSAVRLTRYDDAGHVSWDESLTEAPGEPDNLLPPISPQGGTDTTVDILVLYNTSLASVPIWQNAVDQIQAIRTAMEVSTTEGQSTIAEVRLAGAAWITRNVSGVSGQDLRFLKDSPTVAALRGYYAADVVLYLNSGSCIAQPGQSVIQGIAFLPGFDKVPAPPAPDWAYAASLFECSDNPGDWVAAHEVAHVFGANHNMDHEPHNLTPLRPYAWGHWARHVGTIDPREGARTIMSYVEECDAVTDLCPRIQHYSNPSIEIDDWFTTGSAEHNNARLIQDYALILARYRDSQGRIFKNGFD